MLYTIKQLKGVFKMMIVSALIEKPVWLPNSSNKGSLDFNKAIEDWRITKEEAKILKENYDIDRKDLIDIVRKYNEALHVDIEAMKTFTNLDKTIWGLDNANPTQVKMYQEALMAAHYDLSYTKKDWTTHLWNDGYAGKKTWTAYNDYKAKITEWISYDKVVIENRGLQKEVVAEGLDQVVVEGKIEWNTTVEEVINHEDFFIKGPYNLTKDELSDINVDSLYELVSKNRLRKYTEKDKSFSEAKGDYYDDYKYWGNIGYEADGFFGSTELSILNKVRGDIDVETVYELKDRESSSEKEKREWELDTNTFLPAIIELDNLLDKKSITINYRVRDHDAVVKNLSLGDDEKLAEYINKKITISWNTYLEKLNNLKSALESEDGDDIRDGLLDKLWYDDERWVFVKLFKLQLTNANEKDSIISRINNILKLNEGYTDSEAWIDTEQLKDYLLDLDFDSIIETKSRDNASERNIDDYIRNHDFWIEDFKHIFENMWFWDSFNLDDISRLSFRDKFSKRLKELLKMWVPFVVLTKENGYKDFMNRYSILEKQLYNKKIKEAREYITQKEPELRKKLIDKDIDPDAIDKITGKTNIEATKEFTLWAVIWCVRALGVNVNIEELTSWVFDWLSIGYSEGKLWFALDKELFSGHFKNTWLSITWVLSPTWYWANASISQEFNERLSADDIMLSLWASVWVSWNGVAYEMYNISINEHSSTNAEGFNEFMRNSSEAYDLFMEKIHQWDELNDDDIKSLYSSWAVFNLSKQDIQRVKNNFEDLRNIHNDFILNLDNSEPGILEWNEAKLRKAVLETAANKMYEQVAWFDFAWVGAFIIPWVVQWVYGAIEYNWIEHEVKENTLKDVISQDITESSLAEMLEHDEFLKENVKIEWNSIFITNTWIENGINIYTKMTQVATENGVKYTPILWNRLNINVKRHYSYDSDMNGYKKFDMTINSEKLVNTWGIESNYIDDNPYESMLDSVEKVFTPGTRYNTPAEKVVGKLWDIPQEKRLQARWEALGELISNTKLLRESADLNKWYKEFNTKSDTHKLYLLTVVSQYISKSLEIQNHQEHYISNVKKEFDKTKEPTRRAAFNKLIVKHFGVSLWDIPNEYYARYTSAWKKKELIPSSVNWIGFDIKSMLHVGKNQETVSWALRLWWRIDVLADENWPILFPLNNATLIKNFVSNLSKVQLLMFWAKNWSLEEMQKQIQSRFDSGNLELNYTKALHGFDDLLIVTWDTKSLSAAELAWLDDPIWVASSSADIVDTSLHTSWAAVAWTECIECKHTEEEWSDTQEEWSDTEEEWADTETEPESSQTQEDENSQTEPESSQTEPETSETTEPESSQTSETETSETQTEPESSETQYEWEWSVTDTPPPQVDE